MSKMKMSAAPLSISVVAGTNALLLFLVSFVCICDAGVPKDYLREQPDGYKKPESYYSDTYLKRGPEADFGQKKSLGQKWGKWNFADPKKDNRPDNDFYKKFTNRDVPAGKFPDNAWQRDPAYMKPFLKESIDLCDRALEAILGEYGHSKFDEPDKTFEERSVMFTQRAYNMSDAMEKGPHKKRAYGDGGWHTEGSDKVLQRRLLHAVMTEDTFVYVMGGHSSSAGHGNHFVQSYTHTTGRYLEPVLARLGVTHESRNFGMGGMGTIHNSIGMGAIYGQDIDLIRWDSGMTEGSPNMDVFYRQAVASGQKVPGFYGGDYKAFQGWKYHETGVDIADFGSWGSYQAGTPETKDQVQVNELPWAARWLECPSDLSKYCRENAYNGTCWIERDDVNVTGMKFKAAPGGRAKWHPGNRYHGRNGKAFAFYIIQNLREALKKWQGYASDNYIVPDDEWHMTNFYDSVREKMANLKGTPCFDNPFYSDNHICTHPLNALSEHTPRYYPEANSIRSAMKMPKGHTISSYTEPNFYDPPDVHNPLLWDVPKGQVDYLAIIENGIDFTPNLMRPRIPVPFKPPPVPKILEQRALSSTTTVDDGDRRLKGGLPSADSIVPGQGWHLDAKDGAPDNCDGTHDSFCGRNSDCPLYGHNDYRGNFNFDTYSGWMVLNLKKVKRGSIMLKIQHWGKPGTNPKTETWECENGRDDCHEGSTSRRLRAQSRNLLFESTYSTPECAKNWRFQFSIDGKITSWDKDEFQKQINELDRLTLVWVLMNDPDFNGGKAKDVELAIRVTGCKREETQTLQLTHVYFA